MSLPLEIANPISHSGTNLCTLPCKTWKPRADLLQGLFNPEIFTVSLSQVIDSYRGLASARYSLYTDTQQFFRDSTYPTEDQRMALADVISRLTRHNSAPAIHRLETILGRAKPHTLIALTYAGFRGRELASVIDGLVDP